MTGPYDYEEVVAVAGVDLELARRFWVALGFPINDQGEKVFTDDDAQALRFVGELVGSGAVEERVALQVTRVMASSLARVADAQVEVVAEQARGLAPDEAEALLGRIIEQMPWLLGYVWARHASAAWRRMVETGTDDVPLTVGFADLVGFTALSQQVSEVELASIVDRFTTLAYETVVSLGGRVVKTIGDEVMYATDLPVAAVEIGLTLAERHRDDEDLSDVRVGIARGDVLDHDGDLFGPPVNLASRITNIARPGAVVVDEAVRDALAGEDYDWRPIRPRNLKGIGKVPLWRVRRAGP